MPASSAISVTLAVLVLCVWPPAALAQTSQARQPGVSRSSASNGPAVVRKKQPLPHRPTQDEKSWMDRASATSNSGGGGMGM